jgi:hypothetical protein
MMWVFSLLITIINRGTRFKESNTQCLVQLLKASPRSLWLEMKLLNSLPVANRDIGPMNRSA